MRPREDTERLLTGLRSYLTSSFSESLDGANPLDLAGRFADPTGLKTGSHSVLMDDPLGDRVVPLMGDTRMTRTGTR